VFIKRVKTSNEFIHETETLTDIEDRLMVAKGERSGGGKECEFGVSRGKLVYLGQINNKVLL